MKTKNLGALPLANLNAKMTELKRNVQKHAINALVSMDLIITLTKAEYYKKLLNFISAEFFSILEETFV